jgi:arylsulfatase A-like enzyme
MRRVLALLGEIKFVDQSIGAMVSELDKRGFLRSTVVIVSAKHGQSPINPKSNHNIGDTITPALGNIQVLQATEDDVALLWLKDQSQANAAAAAISAAAASTALDEVFVGNAITQVYNDPLKDPRTPDLIVNPNVGTIYTTSSKKIAEHGGFGHDDTNVALLVYHPEITAQTATNPVNTAQIAPTILAVLGLNPDELQAVKKENTQLLPGLFEDMDR